MHISYYRTGVKRVAMSHVAQDYGLSNKKTECEGQVKRLLLHNTFIFLPKDEVCFLLFICTEINLCYAGHWSEEAISSPGHCQHNSGVKALQGLGMLDVSVKLWRQRFSGSMVRRFRWGREPKLDRRREETMNLQEIDEDKTKDQLQLLLDTYSWGCIAYDTRT